ncbi:MAG: zinc ribbon domain-containing protein [Acidiferrobacterales bacterium]|nr:zinc ribbon domain-containing protein [Acidiferrobacterales bacterium]
MPVYDYKCKDHGIFYGLATFEDSGEPRNCPHCGKLAPRVILVAPDMLGMDSDKRKAFEVNEKNQHEPTVSSKARREEDDQHSRGCGCARPKNKSKLMYTARGEKMFPSMRPWMISH